MREIGTVTEIKGKYAAVKVEKKDECSKCGMCLFPKGASSITFNAENALGAKKGDCVIVESVSDGKLVGALLVFLVPLILIGLAAVINYFFIHNEIWILILSVIFIVLWYTILAAIDKIFARSDKFGHKIVEITVKEEENE